MNQISARSPESISYLLVNPPLTDPTTPYHSIPYLVGAAQERGFTEYTCVDSNLDALNFLSRPENVAKLLQRAAETIERIENSTSMTLEDEARYQIALTATGLEAGFVAKAISVFQDPELFYHHPTYREAVSAVKRWQRLLCLDGLPWLMENFELTFNMINLSSVRDLTNTDAIDVTARPFEPYIRGPFTELLRSRSWDLIGFSTNYTSQLPFALRLARHSREVCPESQIVFGGTEVCDVVRFTKGRHDFWDVFSMADIIVPGEGESPLCAILEALRAGERPRGIRGALCRADGTVPVIVNYENIATLPPPKYDVWDLNAYWSPEPVILYSPTRGCYWNKCTFCDYGLNSDHPTSPSRDRPAEKVVEDLTSVRAFSRTVYFAVDAMSPRYLRSLCEAIASSGLDVSWSAELRLERTFPKRRMAELLKAAGCVAISFGYESGTQRILDLIDKGTRITEVPAILETLAGQGIGAQMMGFTGFPSETDEEASETYRFLSEHRNLWTLAGLGEFTVTPGSIVAKQPGRFGIELIELPSTEDIYRYLPFHDQALGLARWPATSDEKAPADLAGYGIAEPKFADLEPSTDWALSDRPFVGGIDTAHTLLYFSRFGRELLPDNVAEAPVVRLAPLSSRRIGFASLNGFLSRPAIRSRYLRQRHYGGASYQDMMSWLRTSGTAKRGSAEAIVLGSGTAMSVPRKASQRLREAIVMTGKAHDVPWKLYATPQQSPVPNKHRSTDARRWSPREPGGVCLRPAGLSGSLFAGRGAHGRGLAPSRR